MNNFLPTDESRVDVGRLSAVDSDVMRLGREVWETDRGRAIRADANAGDDSISLQRLMIRHTVESAARQARVLHGRADVSEPVKQRIVSAMCEAMGIRKVSGGGFKRADAVGASFPGELVDRGGDIIRPLIAQRALSDFLPRRPVDPAMQIVEVRGLQYSGGFDVHKPGQTVVPLADAATVAQQRQMYVFVTSTRMDWQEALYSGRGYNHAAEKAEAADRTLRDGREAIIAQGYAGTQLKGLAGLVVNRTFMDLTGMTIGQAYSALMTKIQGIRAANGYRGGVPNTAFIAPQVRDLLYSLSNIDTGGGGVTGTELFNIENAMSGIWGALGLRRIIETPSLGYFADADGTPNPSGNYAAILITEDPSIGAVKVQVAMEPAPVRTAADLTADTTLYAMKQGDVTAVAPVNCGLIYVKVR